MARNELDQANHEQNMREMAIRVCGKDVVDELDLNNLSVCEEGVLGSLLRCAAQKELKN